MSNTPVIDAPDVQEEGQKKPQYVDIAVVRNQRGLTQMQLAVMTGINVKSISAWESGRNPIPEIHKGPLAKGLRIRKDQVPTHIREAREITAPGMNAFMNSIKATNALPPLVITTDTEKMLFRMIQLLMSGAAQAPADGK